MKKTYLKPEIEVTEMVVESLMDSTSFGVNPTDAGGASLSKENEVLSFDIWETDEEE